MSSPALVAPVPTVRTATHCPYCSLQCGIELTAGGRPASLQPQPDFPTNLGGLCSKGWNATSLLDHLQRLLSPMVRTVGVTAPARSGQPAGTRRSGRSSRGFSEPRPTSVPTPWAASGAAG
ncbi:MAG: hypothetical protein ACR2LI_16340 [Propionibacteriaceae bacterium]